MLSRSPLRGPARGLSLSLIRGMAPEALIPDTVTMTRFTKTKTTHDGGGHVEHYTLDLGNGHVVTREDHIDRLGAGRKGRAASVSVVRVLNCTCGGHLGFGGLTVAEDLSHLPHFDSPEAKAAYDAGVEAQRARILKNLGMEA